MGHEVAAFAEHAFIAVVRLPMKARVVDVRAVEATSEKIVVAELSEEEKARRAREAADEEHRQALVREARGAAREIEQLREDAKREAQQTLAAARIESVQIRGGGSARSRGCRRRQARRNVDRGARVRSACFGARSRSHRGVGGSSSRSGSSVARSTSDADVIVMLRSSVLQEAREARPLVIEVHPADVDALRAAVASGGLQDTAGVAIDLRRRSNEARCRSHGAGVVPTRHCALALSARRRVLETLRMHFRSRAGVPLELPEERLERASRSHRRRGRARDRRAAPRGAAPTPRCDRERAPKHALRTRAPRPRCGELGAFGIRGFARCRLRDLHRFDTRGSERLLRLSLRVFAQLFDLARRLLPRFRPRTSA